MKVAVSLARNVLAPLATMASASAIDGAISKKLFGKGIVRTEKIITLVSMTQDTDNIVRIIKSAKN